MKYVVVVGDGMADYPLKVLKDKTPLEVASTPNMDFIASKGKGGKLVTIPNRSEERRVGKECRSRWSP